MKNSNFLYWILAAMLFVTSCQDDDQELGRMLDKSEIDFEVEQDFSADPGGNTVILKNNTPGTVSIWDYGTGRSNRALDTVRFPFQGDYEIKFSVLTAGGIVDLDPVSIQVTEDNLSYVSDPLWTLLTGGVGKEKTWLLDGDANGDSKFFTSPMYFAGEENVNSEFDGTSLIWTKQCAVEGGAQGICFVYEPNWKSDIWVGPVGDYGYMTFNLKGGPFVTTNHKMIPEKGEESGTYFLDVNNLRLTLTDATPLHIPWVPDNAVSLNDVKIISLSEHTMQLAVKDKAKTEYIILNYISKEYNDNWVPEEPEEPQPDEGFDPTFAPGELLNMLTGGPSSGRIWEIDVDGNPVDWIVSGRGWTTDASSSDNWGWNDSWSSAVEGSWIRFDRFGGLNYSRYQNGTLTTGTFTINEETNEITLVGNTLLQNPGSWMSPSTNDDDNSVIKVVKAFQADYQTKGIWFGTSYTEYDDQGNYKDEWLTFHYIIPQ